jgi:hypothetical protein
MRLRVEKDLGVNDVIGRGTAQVCKRQVMEVLLVQQHARARIVDVEKRLQIPELVRGAQRFDRVIRKTDMVALGQRERELGFERAFDVQVQFGFRHAPGDASNAPLHDGSPNKKE